MLNFYADWCRFSQMLRPIFDKAADALSQEFPVSQNVLAMTYELPYSLCAFLSFLRTFTYFMITLSYTVGACTAREGQL